MYKYIIPLLLLTSTMLIAQPEPARDIYGVATFSDTAIWHKNIELICPINWEDGHNDESI